MLSRSRGCSARLSDQFTVLDPRSFVDDAVLHSPLQRDAGDGKPARRRALGPQARPSLDFHPRLAERLVEGRADRARLGLALGASRPLVRAEDEVGARVRVRVGLVPRVAKLAAGLRGEHPDHRKSTGLVVIAGDWWY